jgi:uncharacterized protein
VSARWYEGGLRFECTGCADCCRNHGDYQYVYVTEAEIDVIALFLRLSQEELRRDYLEEVDGWMSARTDLPDCPFLKDERCIIYEVRPKQCSTWPFWSDNLEQPTWNGPVTACCPGIGKGRMYTADEIDAIAADRDDWYE